MVSSNYDIYSLVDFPKKGQKYGRYKGNYPSQAAKKFISFLSKEHNFSNSSNKKALVFSIINNRTKKEYKYVGTRVKLQSPNVVHIKDKKISYKYKNIATLYKDYYANIIKGGASNSVGYINGTDSSNTNATSLLENIKYASAGDSNVLAPMQESVTHYPNSLIKH
mgnify:CR=1 FL=1